VIPIPEQYVVQKFYECVSYPSYNKFSKTYNGACPFCKEGNSFGKKTRFFYIVEKELAYCHNCGYSKKAFNFLVDVTGKSFPEIINEIKQGSFEVIKDTPKPTPTLPPTKSLPDDCINLSDDNQLKFHSNNPVVKICLDVIQSRKLNTAVNRPKTFYLSLIDKVHKNRLVLPFYDENGSIIFYQSRTLLPEDAKLRPKYLGKPGGTRSLYGIHNIDLTMDHVFIFEGPIDSYFIKNGLAVCGITEENNKDFNELQRQQIATLPTFTKVWCLDNQWSDNTSLKKSFLLADANEKVFIWPEELKRYKDINEYCIDKNINGIDPQFIVDNTFTGLKARIMLTNIKNNRS
jgi:hypothetical protein